MSGCCEFQQKGFLSKERSSVWVCLTDVKRSVVTGIIALVMLFIGIGVGVAVPPRTITTTATITITHSITVPTGVCLGTYHIGEPYRAGNFNFIVLGYVMTKYIKFVNLSKNCYEYYSAKPQQKLVVLQLAMRNVGTEKPCLGPSFSASLITDKRNTYDSAFIHDLEYVGSNAGSEIDSQAVDLSKIYNGTSSGYIYPNQTVVSPLVFQIPENEDPAILLFLAEPYDRQRFYEFFIVSLK